MELKSILTDDFDYCFICGMPREQIHHVMNAHNRKKSEKYGLIIPICAKCHDDIHNRNELANKNLKRLAQIKFEMIYGHKKWFEEFGKNYK